VRVLDLFSGIGGFSLGLERAGMRTVAFCEIEPYCRAVLARHWPGVPIFGDIRTLTADAIRHALRKQSRRRDGSDGASETESQDVDLICGGFPCQDISVAGKGAGLAGERSGLWVEFARLIGELRPRYAVVENVSALCARGLGAVLGDLATLGYDAEWHCIPASYVGAPHRRDRVWIVAYINERGAGCGRSGPKSKSTHAGSTVADANDQRESQPQGTVLQERGRPSDGGESGDVADANSSGCGPSGQREAPCIDSCGEMRDFDRQGLQTSWAQSSGKGWGQAGREPTAAGWWSTEPDVGRVAHGVPARVDRLRALGNAVVPQIPEIIGRAIMRVNCP